MIKSSPYSSAHSKQNSGFVHIVLLLIVIIVIGATAVFFVLRNPSTKTDSVSDIVEKVKNTPYSQLESAINKTNLTETMYITYDMDVTTKITNIKTGLTQNFQATVTGYLTGQTQEDAGKYELSISSPLNPGVSVKISLIINENGDVYLKGPATEGKWWKYSEEKFNEESAEEPTDASLYGFQILSSLMEKNKALLKAIDKNTVEKLPDEESGGKSYSKYYVTISSPDFIAALESDSEVEEKDKNDAKIILSNAIMDSTIYVDKSTNYITKISINANNLKQIPTDESRELGLESAHDIKVTSELSRFNTPINLSEPDPSEVIVK